MTPQLDTSTGVPPPAWGCVGIQLLHPALKASLPQGEPQGEPSPAPWEREITCAGSIFLENSRVLQEMWCPHEFFAVVLVEAVTLLTLGMATAWK